MRPVTTIFVLAATLATSGSFAQYTSAVQQHSHRPAPFEAPKYTEQNLADDWQPLPWQQQCAKATSSIGSRVIALTHRAFNITDYTLFDSTAFTYSGTRGGDPNTAIKCDYSYTFYIGYKSKSVYIYNSSDNVTSIIMQNQYGSSSTWTNTHKSTLTYDASGNITARINEDWDSVSAAWTNYSKYSYTYTTTNKVATFTTQIGTPWTNSSLITNTYDASDNLVIKTSQSWNTTTGVWVNSTRTNLTYNSSNLRTIATIQGWDNTTSTWDDHAQTTYTYDASNRKTLEANRFWNTTTSTWEGGWNTIYSAFTGTVPQTIIEQDWDATSSSYVNSAKYNYTYNSYFQPTTYSMQEWRGTGWEVHAGDNYDQYYYEEYTTGIPNILPATDLTVSPIPAADKINITNNTTQPVSITIIDILGKSLAQTQAPMNPGQGNTIGVANFTNGIYFVKGTFNDGQVITKTITVAK